jgi:hypothetical protein
MSNVTLDYVIQGCQFGYWIQNSKVVIKYLNLWRAKKKHLNLKHMVIQLLAIKTNLGDKKISKYQKY